MRSDRLPLFRAFVAASLLLACLAAAEPARAQRIQSANTAAAPLLLGVDVLERQGFDLLARKRVGLLTHPAGVNRHGRSTVDTLYRAKNVALAALFGPEHGIYGDEQASQPVLDRIDSRTGLPVFSLYGKYRKPTPEMLERIDILVIDLQDIGARSYTFVSCMKLAMEACFAAGKEVIVLDRPNPLGGLKVDGPPLDARWKSYVGAFQVPYVHGLTIGELARMAVSKPGVLDITESERAAARLTVVAMDGWRRYMSWPQTGLKWVATSPNIPDFQAAVGYAMTGLGAQLGGFKHGVGTEFPFRHLRYDGVDLDRLEGALEAKRIAGIEFERESSRAGQGLYVKVADWNAWRPTELSFYMMQIAAELEPQNPFAAAPSAQADLFNKHVGSSSWWSQISQRGAAANVSGFITLWERQAKQFQIESRRFWLYD